MTVNAQRDKRVVLVASKANTSSVTTTARLDTLGVDHATISINLGIEKNTNAIGPTIILKEGDTTSSFATWSSSCTITGADGDLVAAKQVVFHVDTRNRKRYLELTLATATATNDDVVWGAEAVLSRQAECPSSTSDMVNTTNDIVRII